MKITRVTAEVVLDGGSVAAVIAPRRGLVLEAIEEQAADGSSASFRQAEGPLASYRRRVEVAALGAGQFQARQVIDLKVGLPWWSWLLALPLRFSLGRAQPEALKPGPAKEVRFPWWAPPQRLDRRQAMVMATLAAVGECAGVFGGATARNAHLCG